MKCGMTCENTATVFGPHCPVMCDKCARNVIQEGDVSIHDIWPQHHERLLQKDKP